MGWIAVLLIVFVAAFWLYRRRAPKEAAAGCTVSCTCRGAPCAAGHIHCAFINGPMGDPNNPNCAAGCSGQCDGVQPVGHAGLHSCTHGHPF